MLERSSYLGQPTPPPSSRPDEIHSRRDDAPSTAWWVPDRLTAATHPARSKPTTAAISSDAAAATSFQMDDACDPVRRDGVRTTVARDASTASTGGLPMLLLVRHAHAGDKSRWQGPDSLRPLSPTGQAEAAGLVVRLEDYPIGRILSSPTVRCQQTVQPLAHDRRLPIEPTPALGVAQGIDLAAARRQRAAHAGPLPTATAADPSIGTAGHAPLMEFGPTGRARCSCGHGRRFGRLGPDHCWMSAWGS